MRPFNAFLGLCAGLLLAPAPLPAENWAQWRGPNFNGSTSEKNLPGVWTKADHVLWSAPLAGPSGATPIVWGEHIFISTPDAQKNLKLVCLNRRDGSVRWEKTVAVGDKNKGRNNMAAPSPVTDGKSVFVLFGTADLAAFDFDGRELWKRNLGKDHGKFSIMWIYGSSPLLHGGKLYVQVLQRDPPPNDYPSVDDKPTRESYLLCLDPATGRDLWRHVRQTDATKESQEAYTTPIPYRGPLGDELILVGGDHVSAHDASNQGAEFWRARLYTKRDDWYRIVPSAVCHDGLIFASGPKGEALVALKDGGKGNVTESHVAWSKREGHTDWSTPLLYQGSLFVLDGGKKTLGRFEPKTGVRQWSGSLGVSETFWSSPTGADGKIYCLGEGGTVVTLSAGDEFKVLSTVAFEGEGPCRSSVAVAGGQLFIRTAKNLHCVAAKK